jgi:hypothetical protein
VFFLSLIFLFPLLLLTQSSYYVLFSYGYPGVPSSFLFLIFIVFLASPSHPYCHASPCRPSVFLRWYLSNPKYSNVIDFTLLS